MTVIVDDKGYIQLPSVNPGEKFEVRLEPDGRMLLIPVPSEAPFGGTVKLVKKDGYTVGVLDRPINEELLRQALDEFP